MMLEEYFWARDYMMVLAGIAQTDDDMQYISALNVWLHEQNQLLFMPGSRTPHQRDELQTTWRNERDACQREQQ